jgi:O-glycosyl hydrolase
MRFLILVVVSILFLSGGPKEHTSVLIDQDKTCQEIKGWGVSLAWWANKSSEWEEQMLDHMLDELTSEDGLNYNVFRFNIGGGENPDHSHIKKHERDMPGYRNSATSSYNWNADQAQRNVLLNLDALRDDAIFEAFSNSPPYWMTKSACASGGRKGEDNLREDQYEEFADYLIDVITHYRDSYGIEFNTLEPFNEPDANWWKENGGQEGCSFSDEKQVKLLKILQKKLMETDLKTELSSNDANSINHCVRTLHYYEEEGIFDIISQVNTHSYYGNQRDQLASIAAKHDMRIWQSETGPLSLRGSIYKQSLTIAARLIKDIRELQSEVWCDWQYWDPHPAWTLVSFSEDGSKLEKTKSFFLRRQVSAYIKQGYQVLSLSYKNILAAQSPDRSEVVLILVNESLNDKYYSLQVAGQNNEDWEWKLFRTNDTNENCTIADSGKQLQDGYIAKSMSLSTIVLNKKN